MNRASPRYRHLRQAVELILSDLAQDNRTAVPDKPASTTGNGRDENDNRQSGAAFAFHCSRNGGVTL